MINWDPDKLILTIQDLNKIGWIEFDKLFKRRLVNEHDYIAKQEWTCDWLKKQIKKYFKENNLQYYHWYVTFRVTQKNGDQYIYLVLVIEHKDKESNYLFSTFWLENVCSCFYWEDSLHHHDFDWLDNFEYLVLREPTDKLKPFTDIGDAMDAWEKEHGF